ncbi:MAG: FAD-dependent monooxygenase [Pseudomonadota bacterium]
MSAASASAGTTSEPDYDVVIVGGGLVGASLGLGCGKLGIRTAIIEQHNQDDQSQPAFDERTVALTYSSKSILSALGIWSDIQQDDATPIVDIHVSQVGRFGASHLHSKHAGTEALGYVVPIRVISQIIGNHIAQLASVHWLRPDCARDVTTESEAALIGLDSGRKISASLLVIADGGRSELFQRQFRISENYEQSGIVCYLKSDRPNAGHAYERFTRQGPIALLPYGLRDYSLVWTTDRDTLSSRLELTDEAFIEQLQYEFGDRAGQLSSPTKRQSYPFVRKVAEPALESRQILIGNAAHTVHPVAGQGFNLGLRAVVALLSLLRTQRQEQKPDPGSQHLIDQYLAARRRETQRVSQFTHGLLSVFSGKHDSLRSIGAVGLSMVEMSPLAKRVLLRKTMGLTSEYASLPESFFD